MKWLNSDTAVSLIAFAGIAITLGQLMIAVNQHKMNEAATYARQSLEWERLYQDWQRCILMALGPERARWYGIGENESSKLAIFLRDYYEVQKILLFQSGINPSEEGIPFNPTAAGDPDEEILRSEEAKKEYELSCTNIVAYLARTSSLVIRDKISIDSVYRSLGPDLISIGANIRGLVSPSWDWQFSGAAPENEERRYRLTLGYDELSQRAGWGDSLRRSRATAERVLFLQNIMIAHAFDVGDIDTVAEYHPEYGTVSSVTELCLPAKLGLTWKAARTQSLCKSIRFSLKVSFSCRRARRNYPSEFDSLIWKFCGNLVRAKDSDEQPDLDKDFRRKYLARFISTGVDFCRIAVDVWVASKAAGALTDVRNLDAPISIRERHPQGSSADDKNSIWQTRFEHEESTRGLQISVRLYPYFLDGKIERYVCPLRFTSNDRKHLHANEHGRTLRALAAAERRPSSKMIPLNCEFVSTPLRAPGGASRASISRTCWSMVWGGSAAAPNR